MRVSTAFNKMLGIVGAVVASVTFTPTGIVVGLRRRRARLVCPCGWKTWAVYDRSVRRWRHLDLAGSKLWLETEIRRLACRRCGRVRTEEVPWARPGARHTRDLQDVVAFMAQRMDKTTITRLLRVSWEAVARIVIDVVADQLDTTRLDGLFRIGVDEVSYRKGHRYLTVVADHDRDGAVVWAHEGKNAATLEAFYDELGEDRCAQLKAVSLDMGGAYKKATDARAAQARQCVDPFHLVKLANEAIDKTRRWAWNVHRDIGVGSSRWVKRTRWALLKDPDHAQGLPARRAPRAAPQPLGALPLLATQRRRPRPLPPRRPHHRRPTTSTGGWPGPAAAASPPSSRSPKTVRANRDRILAAVELGLSNSKLEGLNSKIRLINHRGYGHHSAAAVIAMIYLCCGGITIELPFK